MKLQTDTAVITRTLTCSALNYAAGDLVGDAGVFFSFPEAAARFRVSGAVVRAAAIVDDAAETAQLDLLFYNRQPVIGGGSVSPGDAWSLTAADAAAFLGQVSLPALAGQGGSPDCAYAAATSDPPLAYRCPEKGALYVALLAGDGHDWTGGTVDVTLALTVDRW